jgi:uncharacterized protein (TIGR03437 family)
VVHQAPGAAPGTNPRQDFALVVSNAFGLNVSRPPAVLPNGVVSAASFVSGPVSPGELLSIFGSNLGPTPPRGLELDASGNLKTQLGPTRVLFDGQAAPLLFASAGQINVVAPTSIAGQVSTFIEVEVDGVRSAPVAVSVSARHPGIFTLGGSQGAVLNQNGTINGAASRAARGSVIQIFATGGGETAPPLVAGGIAPSPAPLHLLAASVQVQIGGVNAPVQFAGASPGSVFGLVQINASIPQTVTPGPAVPLTVSIGGVVAQPGVTVAVS